MSTRALSHAIRGFGLMAFCLLSGGAWIGSAAARGSDTLLAELTAAAAPSAALDDPEPYVSEKGKFRFRFPGEPKLTEQKNGAVLIHSAMHIDSNGTTYGVTYTDLKPAPGRAIQPDAVLDGGVNGLAKSGAWKISTKKAIKLGEYPGRDVTADVALPGAPEPGFGRTRIYLAGTRLYQVILLGLKSKVSSADFDKYLESFELLPGAAEAAENAVAEIPEPFVSEKGKFRFQFPGKPEISEQKTGELVIHATMYATADGTTYGVTYTDLNPAAGHKIDPDQILDRGVNGMATSGGWKILSKNSIKLGEYPGRDITGDVTAPDAPETGLGRTRMFLVGNPALSESILIGPKSKVSVDDFQNYLDSFAILREAPAMAKAKAKPAPSAAAATAKAKRNRQPMVKRGSPPGKAVATRTAPRNAKPAADRRALISMTTRGQTRANQPRSRSASTQPPLVWSSFPATATDGGLAATSSARPHPRADCWWACESATPRPPRSARFSRSFRPVIPISRASARVLPSPAKPLLWPGQAMPWAPSTRARACCSTPSSSSS